MVNQEETGRHRIFCLMGKSGTGKDTIYRELLSDGALPFERLVPCTTRPIRAGEQDGREYHFYSVEEFRALERAGKIIESRCYETVHGPWYYFTADDGQIVVARIGDEATVKRLRRRNGEVWLLPENENYAPIDGREAEILGIVKAVFREY